MPLSRRVDITRHLRESTALNEGNRATFYGGWGRKGIRTIRFWRLEEFSATRRPTARSALSSGDPRLKYCRL